MKLLLRAAMAAVSIGSIPPAIAGEGGPDPEAELPSVVAQAPAQKVPSIKTAQRLLVLQTETHTGHGPWLFPPIGKYLDQHAGGSQR